MELKRQLECKLRDIADVLREQTLSSDYTDTGMCEYTMGTVMFFGYYRKYLKTPEYDDLLDGLLDRLFDKISRGIFMHTYSTGMAGTLYGLMKLQEEGLIAIDLAEAQNYYDEYLKIKMFEDIRNGNTDFLHGATGVGNYLLKYASPAIKKETIGHYIDYLESAGTYSDDSIKWPSNVHAGDGVVFNIALSHGMSGIAIYFSHILNYGLEIQRVEQLLYLTINYILKQEIDKNLYGSYYPYTSIESTKGDMKKSRLGWCYGDLGVALALWQAANSAKNDYWKKKAIGILKYTATRLNPEDNYVLDAGICHGTSGIAQIFRRMYLETNDNEFLTVSNYWIQKTLEMAKWQDGLAGYKAWSGTNNRWENNLNFLEGISGIGLTLIAALGDNRFSKWDEILLLSYSL